MSHFEIGNWVDYVRGITSGPDAAEIGEHLKLGCTECLETHLWLTRVSESARASKSFEVPPELLQAAKQVFRHPADFHFARLFALDARLVLNANQTLHTVGIRTGSTVDHALYQAGSFTIDLRQESGYGSSQISLFGQISNEIESDGTEARFPVALFAGSSILSSTTSNRFGQFSVTYTRRPRLMLTIAIIPTGRWIDIPLEQSTSLP